MSILQRKSCKTISAQTFASNTWLQLFLQKLHFDVTLKNNFAVFYVLDYFENENQISAIKKRKNFKEEVNINHQIHS